MLQKSVRTRHLADEIAQVSHGWIGADPVLVVVSRPSGILQLFPFLFRSYSSPPLVREVLR